MPKLRHSHRLPSNMGRIIGCDRIVLPATNNTTEFSYSQGNNIIRFEISPSVGMISPFKNPRLVFQFWLNGMSVQDWLYTMNPYIGLQGLIQQIKVSSLKTGSVIADTRQYPRQVGSVVYNSQGCSEAFCNYLCHEQKSVLNWLNYGELTASLSSENKLVVSIPITTNLLESANLLQTHLFGLGGGLQIEIMLASDNSLLYIENITAPPATAGTQPTYVIDEVRLHYDLLRFDASSVGLSGMKQILFESTDSRADTIQSNDETRNVPLTGSAVQSLVIDAVASGEVNDYNADSNEQQNFGLNTLRIMVQGQSLPIQQELTYAQDNQLTRSSITPIEREDMKAISHDAELSHIRSMNSQDTFEGQYVALGEQASNGPFTIGIPYPTRSTFGCLFGKEGVSMKYGNLSYRVQSTPAYAESYDSTTADEPQIPATQLPYTIYTHITSLKVLQVDEGSGLVSVRT